jgi:hypothetical protein
VEEFTDRELIHERFHWSSYGRMVQSHRELERRGYVLSRDGNPMSEENLLGQEGLRRRRTVGGVCGLRDSTCEEF